MWFAGSLGDERGLVSTAAPSPTAPVYGLSPAHLQGLPLTAGWPGGFALAPSSIYNRLTYDPYSNAAAYANMINSMYGLTISV